MVMKFVCYLIYQIINFKKKSNYCDFKPNLCYLLFGFWSWFEVLQGISISKRWYEIHYGQHLPALGATKRLRN
ncbi:hypothetical protein MTR_8g052100 [Medicago truncatula]|uniref:Uncharacterized protein n=1 Tax=Medicago truncatula TaxID=3880 RepID=A0A072U0U6_MEDTR|nr:hypothetical protein MTR_8g052100 [Medicago truncatula]